MDDVQRTMTPRTLKLGDREFKMRPMDDVDIAEIDEWLQQQVIDLAEKFPLEAREEARRIAIMEAAGTSMTSAGGRKILATPKGMARLVWQSCKHQDPKLKESEVFKLIFSPESIAEANRVWKQLNGVSGNGEKKGHTTTQGPKRALRKTTSTVRSRKGTGGPTT